MLTWINAQGFERLEIEFLRIARIGLENDLILRMQLEAIRILAVTPVVGTDRRLDIRHVPRLRSEHAQEGGRVHRPCADLGVVRLCDQTSVRGPEVLKFEDDFLKR